MIFTLFLSEHININEDGDRPCVELDTFRDADDTHVETEASKQAIQSLYKTVEHGEKITGKIEAGIKTAMELHAPSGFVTNLEQIMLNLFYGEGKM